MYKVVLVDDEPIIVEGLSRSVEWEKWNCKVVATAHDGLEGRKIIEEVNPDIHVFTGRIVSGDQFISSKEVKNRIIDNFHGLCTEMEGAAIAHAAFLNQIPFVIIRAISDKADDSAEMDYPTFEKKAAEHSAKLVEHMVAEI